MNRFHSILFMVILAFASSAFAAEHNSVDGKWLGNGFFDIAKENNEGGFSISKWDSAGGVYLFVEYGWDGPCCVSPDYLRFSIGKNIVGNQNDSIWLLTDFTNIDTLHSELKKGKSLTLKNFTKLEFDSTHVQYLVHATNQRGDIEIKSGLPLENSPNFHDYIESLSNLHGNDYVLYKRENMVTALCGITSGGCYYKVGCFYRNDGLLFFDSLPDPEGMVRTVGCPDGMGSPLPPINQNLNKLNILDAKTYKINGSPATKGSSNIVIQNKQPKLWLKGK